MDSYEAKKEYRVVSVILGAGSGERMKSPVPKTYLPVAGQEMFLYSVRAFRDVSTKTVLVTAENKIAETKRILENAGLLDRTEIVPGGEQRVHSSYNGICAAEGADIVLIHDAARPMVSQKVILTVLIEAARSGAAVPAVPVKDTLKTVENGTVTGTPDRSKLFACQTPQGFSYDLVRSAYEKMFESGDLSGMTDDSAVVERFAGHPVRTVPGDPDNIKVTTKDDLRLLTFILGKPH